MAWIIWNEYQAPMESRKSVALCSKLYKTEEEHKYFLVFEFWKKNKNKRNKQQSKILLDFWIANYIRTKQTKTRDLKKQTKRNHRNIFGLFVFWESRTKQETTKRKKKTKHGYTKYQHNMIYRWVCGAGIPPTNLRLLA